MSETDLNGYDLALLAAIFGAPYIKCMAAWDSLLFKVPLKTKIKFVLFERSLKMTK